MDFQFLDHLGWNSFSWASSGSEYSPKHQSCQFYANYRTEIFCLSFNRKANRCKISSDCKVIPLWNLTYKLFNCGHSILSYIFLWKAYLPNIYLARLSFINTVFRSTPVSFCCFDWLSLRRIGRSNPRLGYCQEGPLLLSVQLLCSVHSSLSLLFALFKPWLHRDLDSHAFGSISYDELLHLPDLYSNRLELSCSRGRRKISQRKYPVQAQ